MYTKSTHTKSKYIFRLLPNAEYIFYTLEFRRVENASITMVTKYTGYAGPGVNTTGAHVRAVVLLAKLCTLRRSTFLFMLVLGHRFQR